MFGRPFSRDDPAAHAPEVVPDGTTRRSSLFLRAPEVVPESQSPVSPTKSDRKLLLPEASPAKPNFNHNFFIYNPQKKDDWTAGVSLERQSLKRTARVDGSAWPPRKLVLTRREKLSRVWPEVLFLLVSLAFAVLGCYVLYLKDKPVSSPQNAGAIVQATQVAPTLWPIIFSAVVASLLKSIAHHKVERGAKLGRIEQLMGSHTVIGTLRSLISLRIFTTTSFLLILVWSMSPLGSQAVLRSLVLETLVSESTISVRYMNMDPQVASSHDLMPGTPSGSASQAQVQGLFISALMSPQASIQYLEDTPQESGFAEAIQNLGSLKEAVEVSKMDPWGNVRIPMLHLLPGFDTQAKRDNTWLDVATDTLPPYSSAIGLPLAGLPYSGGVGSLEFTLQTNYVKFDCYNWLVDDALKASRSTRGFNQLKLPSIPARGHFETTIPFNYAEEIRGLKGPKGTTCPSETEARAIIYSKDSGDPADIFCTASTEYVEARISCTRGAAGPARWACGATAVRSDPSGAHLCPSITELDLLNRTGSTAYDPANYMLQALNLNEAGPKAAAAAAPAETFLYDPAQAMRNGTLATGRFAVEDLVPPGAFGARLALAYNTLSQASKDPGLVQGRGPASGRAGATLLAEARAALRSGSAGVVYRVQTAWVALYMAAVGVLVACAAAAAALRWRQAVPDLLGGGGVAGAARDSPYFERVGGSAVGGGERARMMRDVWVRVRDVQPDKRFGRLVLEGTTVGGKRERDDDDRRLVWGRLYE